MAKINGYITVFLSMVLGIILIFVMTVIECARYQTIRMETECLMDAGMNSIFAEYHREMVRQYGMLFIDDSYGGIGSMDVTKQHLLYFMEQSLLNKGGLKDLTSLKVDNASLDKISFASDSNGNVLRYQIGRYMEQKPDLIKEFHYLDISDIDGVFDSYSNKRQEAHGIIDEIVSKYNESLPEDEEPVSISNPADAVEYLTTNNVILYSFSDLSSISTQSTDISNLISSRSYEEGFGLYDEQVVREDKRDNVLISYLFNRLGYFGNGKDNSCLNYQIEYIISKTGNDIDNIGQVLEKIFKTRYVANMNHINSCAAKQEEAEALAQTISAVIASPELVNAVKESILLAWAYIESAKDMRILMDGNKLSLNKAESDWNTSISEITYYKSNLSNYTSPAGEMGYSDYLYSMLSGIDVKNQNMQLMDVMEMDIRMTEGNQNFQMNNQIYQLEATANCSSTYGRGVKITRKKSFW